MNNKDIATEMLYKRHCNREDGIGFYDGMLNAIIRALEDSYRNGQEEMRERASSLNFFGFTGSVGQSEQIAKEIRSLPTGERK